MLTLRRLAELATMVLVAFPLFGCGNAGTGDAAAGDARSRQYRAASGATPDSKTDGADAVGVAQDLAPADAAAADRISRIEGRHFDMYRDYRLQAARQMHAAADGVDDDDADGAVRHAVISFSASSLNQALRGCSMRALLALD